MEKNQKQFYSLDYGIVDKKDFYDLLQDAELCKLIIKQSNWIVWEHNALAYYVNNVISVRWAPKRVWSFACDVSYWITDQTNRNLSELIGFIIDQMRYYDDSDANEEDGSSKNDLFQNRLNMRFWCITTDWRLPRSRWTDNMKD
jgi:hypothetical protein